MNADNDVSGTATQDEAVVATVLMNSLRTRGVRRATGAYVTEWKKVLAASGLPRNRTVPAGAWQILHLGPATQPSRDNENAVEAVAELVAETLSAQERLRLAQFLIATVELDENDNDAHDIGRSVAEFATGKRQADLDSAKKSVLASLEVIDSKEVARILAPTGTAVRSVAQKRRVAGDLIGLPVGARPNYRYPYFQFDTQRHKIHDVVRHANRRLHVNKDPYGAAGWWLTPVDLLDGSSPLEDLEAGRLTEIAVDNVIDYARQGM